MMTLTKKTMNPLIRLTLLWLLMSLCSGVQAVELKAFVDRTQLALNETFMLSVRFDSNSVSGEPDFGDLGYAFEVLRKNRSSQFRSINGRVESWTQWDLTLAPKQVGQFVIPPFELESARSTTILIDVKAQPESSTGSRKDYYLELEVDKPSPYLQEQLLVTLRLHSAVNLSELRAPPLSIPNTRIVQLDEQQYEQIQQGRRFGIYEIRYALFPQQTGPLEIPAQRFTAVMKSRLNLFQGGAGQMVRLMTKPRTIEVQGRPATVNATDWLPLSALTLTQTWSQNPSEFRVGEPITRTLILKANGVEAAGLPPLDLPEREGIKIYPEPAKSSAQKTATGLEADTELRPGSHSGGNDHPTRHSDPLVGHRTGGSTIDGAA
jgi:hypothetical protein